MPSWPSIARLSRLYSSVPTHSFSSLISNPAHKYQIYISQSRDPFLNLSIEHHLLQKSHKDSTILFLYTNNPCVVIGRNQNPWLEVNLKLLNAAAGEQAESEGENRPRVVDLVRRRSGGGAVFHDEGNLNYSVICPSAAFTRDKHAEMVTRAMRKFNLRARVNERHDIVLDQGSLQAESSRPDPDDMHQTSYATSEMPPLKVSGSAYKLTRERSLHHGTCLLSSENLSIIGKYLASPARGYIKARGVESVRSPVGNVISDRADKEQARFQHEVIGEFAKLYRIKGDIVARFDADFDMACLGVVDKCSYGHIGEELLSEVNNGVEEMKSLNWTYCQTPQFTLSSHASEEDASDRPPLPQGWPPSARVFIKARSGIITSIKISISSDPRIALEEEQNVRKMLENRRIHEVPSFRDILSESTNRRIRDGASVVVAWLDKMFGK